MAPKRNPIPKRAVAKAKAAALAVRVAHANARRDRRRDACRALNQLANELGVGQAAVDAKGASGAEVDRFIRLLERRVLSDGQLERLRAAAKAFADNGGETAVSWLRIRLAESVPAKAWAETREQYTSRLRACCQAVNSSYNVDGLCRAFPARIAKLRDAEGGRLKE